MPSYPLYRGWYDQYGDMDVDWMNDGHMPGEMRIDKLYEYHGFNES